MSALRMRRPRFGITKVRMKLILRGLVVEVEENSNPGRCVTSFA